MATVYDFNLKDKKGNEVSLETYKGKVLLIVKYSNRLWLHSTVMRSWRLCTVV